MTTRGQSTKPGQKRPAIELSSDSEADQGKVLPRDTKGRWAKKVKPTAAAPKKQKKKQEDDNAQTEPFSPDELGKKEEVKKNPLKSEKNPFIDDVAVSDVDEACEVKSADGTGHSSEEDNASNTADSSAGFERGKVESPNSDIVFDVMVEELQDVVLQKRNYYKGLPDLGPTARVIRTNDGSSSVVYNMYSDVAETMRFEQSKRQLRRALAFQQYMCYIHLARCPIDITIPFSGSNHRRRLKVIPDDKSSPRQAVCITTGIVTDCKLVEPGENSTHYITATLFAQEARREMTYLGLKFNFESISGHITQELGMKFATIPEGKGYGVHLDSLPGPPTSSKSTPTTPKKGLVVKQPVSPSKWAKFTYSSALNYEEDIPIYDGHGNDFQKGFQFSAEEWDALKEMKRYKKGGSQIDAPVDSLVSIGYAPGTYKGETNGVEMFSSSILFVIVLCDKFIN